MVGYDPRRPPLVGHAQALAGGMLLSLAALLLILGDVPVAAAGLAPLLAARALARPE